MSLTMSPATRSLVEGALLAKGTRYVNKVSDVAVREALSATLAARVAADARMAGIARTSAELDALMLQYPDGYLADVADAFWYSKQAKAVAAAWRARVALIGFTPSDTELRRMAVLHSTLQRTASLYWATPVADIDLDSTNPHNRFMRKVHSNMAGKWRELTWASVDATDVFHTACELAVRETGHPTIGNLYRALNRAYSLERRVAFGTRGPGMVSVDDVSELAYNRAFDAQVERLASMGRVLLTPEALIADTYSDLAGTLPALPGNRVLLSRYATAQDGYKAVKAAQDDAKDRAEAIAKRNEERRAKLLTLAAEQTETDASAQYGASIVALLIEGNTLTDIAEFFGLTVETVTKYARETRVTESDEAPTIHSVIEILGERMRIIAEFHDKADAWRFALTLTPRVCEVVERTPDRVPESDEVKRHAHWNRSRGPVPLLGNAPDKFHGVKVAA